MRLIDADRLLEWWKPDIGRQFYADQFIHTIEFAPTIEPKHGKWIVTYIDGIKQTECSACGESFTTYDVYGWNYCPWCGARMKGADDDSDSE